MESSEQRSSGSTPGRFPGARALISSEGARDFLAWPGENGEQQRETTDKERLGLGGFEAAPERLALHCGCHRKRLMVRELRGWWMAGGGDPRPGTIRRLLQSSGKEKGSGWRAGLQGGPGWGRQPLEVPWGRF